MLRAPVPNEGDLISRVPISEIQGRIGFLTMAFGAPRYLRQAENLALSLRLHMPNVPLAIVTDVEGPLSLFDKIIRLDKSRGMGVVQKVFMDSYSPFHDTLFIDSDCIVTCPFWGELEEIMRYSFTVVGVTYHPDDKVKFIDLKNTLIALKIDRFPGFNGGIYYFTRDATSGKVFEYARGILGRWQSLGLRLLDSSGPNDEAIFGLAIEMAGAALCDDYGRLMRTPVAMIGPLKIEPLGGGTRFAKGDREKGDYELVEPAICHFTGSYINWPEYRRCERLLRGEPVGFLLMVWIFSRKIVKSKVITCLFSCLQRQPAVRKLILAVPSLKLLAFRLKQTMS